MYRAKSPDTMMITLFDIDQSQNQSQKGYRVSFNTTILDLQTHIKKFLDDDYEIYFMFENNKCFDGSLNTYVMNIINQLSIRTIYFKKVLSQKKTPNQFQKSYNIDYERENNNNKNSKNHINIQSQTTQGEYQFSKPINAHNQQEQISVTKIQQGHGPSQKNYIFNKIRIKEVDNSIQQAKPQSMINTQNIQSNAFGTENSKYQAQSQIYSNLTQSQLQIQELQQLKQEKQQTDQQNIELQKQINNLKTKQQEYEEIIRKYQIEIENTKQKYQNWMQQTQYDINKLKEENERLKNENERLKNENERLKNENERLKNENNTLQRNIVETKAKPQPKIDEQKDYYNGQQKLKITEISPTLEQRKEQFSTQSPQLSQSQLYQSQQQRCYRNKCGHNTDISQIQAQLIQALKSNSKAVCNQCQQPIQSKLCLLVEFGKQYLETNNQLEIRQILNNLERKQLKPQEKLVKCSFCQFFCIWQLNQSSRFMQSQFGFCPQCLRNTVTCNELSKTSYQFYQSYQTPQSSTYQYQQYG